MRPNPFHFSIVKNKDQDAIKRIKMYIPSLSSDTDLETSGL